jgi:phosphate transport system substrate-binding protein
MRKIIVLFAAMVLMAAPVLAAAEEITVISREDGSGTRGAFIELFGVEVKNDAGQKVDMTTDEAIITNSTSVMLSGVAGDPNAIGYVSLGALNDTVKALAVDGAPATTDAIKAGEYQISRPFNIAVMENVSEAAQDFINFILSAEGQAVVEASGYIAVADDAPAYAGSANGKVVVAGSSSVTSLMERLKEAYAALNAGVDLEIQQSDSSIGMQAAIDGICDIGMASRAVKDSEIEQGLTPMSIAIDGIAVIVNLDNARETITKDAVRAIYTGEVTDWAEVQ